jgi:3-phosphoshikimate 1-carboxyvinyltransferase
MSRMIFVKPSVLRGVVEAPPSKSYTHRAYAAALLSSGVSRIVNPLKSRDTNATKRACIHLGAEIEEEENHVSVRSGEFRTPDNVIDVENSGTTLRFFTAISAHAPVGYVILTGDDSIRRRPMEPLLKALRMLGVECWSSKLNGTAPIIVRGGGIEGGEARIEGGISSQFISALIYASTKSKRGARIIVEGEMVSRPYIDASLAVLTRFGFRVEHEEYYFFEVEGGQHGAACEFIVPGDFGSAAFLMAGACLTSGDITIKNLSLDLPQADAAIINFLRMLGCHVEVMENAVRVYRAGRACGGEFNLRDSPDLLPILACIAAKCSEEVVLRGVAHARFKESDRIMVMMHELTKLGIEAEPLPDGLRIRGRDSIEGGCILDPHGDHRVFMALAMLAASTERGCVVKDPEVAEVSYPQFLEHAIGLGLNAEVLEE